MKKIYDHLQILHSYDIYHSDIKPENIVFDRNPELDTYEPKLIDFGGAVNDFSFIKQYTPFYFFNGSSRKSRDKIRNIVFKKKEDRIKAEFYSLGIIVLLMIIY